MKLFLDHYLLEEEKRILTEFNGIFNGDHFFSSELGIDYFHCISRKGFSFMLIDSRHATVLTFFLSKRYFENLIFVRKILFGKKRVENKP